MSVRVVVDDLTSPQVIVLLEDHLAAMIANSPPGSVHALDLDALRAPGLTFWSAWLGADLAGCGALKELQPGAGTSSGGEDEGEVKSMRTVPAYLRRGVAAAVLAEIIDTARARGYVALNLETGFGPAFEAAHALYARFGFSGCGPFGAYTDDPFSRFLRLDLR